MPFLGHFVEGVGDTCLNAAGVVGGEAEGAGDGVGRFEADAVDVLHHLVGGRFDDFEGVVPIFFVDFGGEAGGDAVGLQEDHDLFDGPLFVPCFDDLGDPLFADADDVVELFGVFLDDFEGVGAEVVDDPFGHPFADAANEAGA